MTGSVFAIVMLAAALHAGWNALIKGAGDKVASMTALIFGQGIAALIVLPFATMPDPACWPWLVGGVLLHFGYQMFLIASYRAGDLTQVYPIARGVSPLIVALASFLFLGTVFSTAELTGIVMIAVGIGSISLVRRDDGVFQGKAAGLALITGMFIAAYSLNDGVGARVAGTALGFYGVMAVCEALLFSLVIGIARPAAIRGALGLRRHLSIGGTASFVAYALVTYAFTQAPIALVTALRETSIIFALLIGVGILGERFSLLKLASTLTTVAGAALLRLSRGA